MPLASIVNGRPVGPGVKKLLDAFGTVARGQEIPHSKVEALIGEQRKSQRYRAITNAWRRRVHDGTGVFVECVPGVGFRGCVATSQLENGGRAVKSAGKKLALGLAMAQTTPTDQLKPHEVQRREHLLTNGASMIQALKATSRFVLAPPPSVG